MFLDGGVSSFNYPRKEQNACAQNLLDKQKPTREKQQAESIEYARERVTRLFQTHRRCQKCQFSWKRKLSLKDNFLWSSLQSCKTSSTFHIEQHAFLFILFA